MREGKTVHVLHELLVLFHGYHARIESHLQELIYGHLQLLSLRPRHLKLYVCKFGRHEILPLLFIGQRRPSALVVSFFFHLLIIANLRAILPGRAGFGLPKTQTRFNSLRSIWNTLCYCLDWYSKRYFSPAWIWNMRRIFLCSSGMSIHSFNRWLHDIVILNCVLRMYLMRMMSSF